MSRKIIGLTVGTSISPQKIEEDLRPIKTINGVAPDETGNVNVSGSVGSGGDVFYVTATITDESVSEEGMYFTGMADKTSAEIDEAVNAGHSVYLRVSIEGWSVLPLQSCIPEYAQFGVLTPYMSFYASVEADGSLYVDIMPFPPENIGGVTSWDDLEDKPFYEPEPESVTLTFDGNLEGREYYSVPTDHYECYCVKLSDDTPDMEAFLDQAVTDEAGYTRYMYDYYLSAYGADLNNGCGFSINVGPVYITVVKEPFTTEDGSYTVSPGIWVDYVKTKEFYISSLTYLVFGTVQTLDEKFIPDTIARVEDIPDIPVLNWDDLENKPFEVYYEELMAEQTLSRTANSTLPGTDASDLWVRAIVNNIPIEPLEVGETYKIAFAKGDAHYIGTHWQEERHTAKRIAVDGYSDVVVFGDPKLINLSLAEDDSLNSFASTITLATYTKTDGSVETILYSTRNFETTTFSFYKEAVKHIDEKFIPDTVVRVEDLPCRVLEPATTVTYSFDGTLDGKEYVEVTNFGGSGMTGYFVKISDETPLPEKFIGGSLKVVYNGQTVQYEITEEFLKNNLTDLADETLAESLYMSGEGWILGGFVIVRDTVTIHVPNTSPILDSGLWTTYSTEEAAYFSDCTIPIPEVIQQIDEKFIPDTIARTEDIETFGWADLNDRPFEDAVILCEWDINGTPLYTFGPYSDGEQHDQITRGLVDFNFVGKHLYVTTVENGESITRVTEITSDMVKANWDDGFAPPRSIIIADMLVYVDRVAHTEKEHYHGIWIRNGYLYENVKLIDPVKPLDEKFIPDTVLKDGDKEFILTSSTEGSTKKFKITVDDNGTLTATEVVEE